MSRILLFALLATAGCAKQQPIVAIDAVPAICLLVAMGDTAVDVRARANECPEDMRGDQ